jgi:hypothetical protein
MNNSIEGQYLSAGKKLMTLVKGGATEGAPTEYKWTGDDFKQPDDVVLSHRGALGWVLGEDDFVIDVDPRNSGDKSFEKLLCNFPELDGVLVPTVYTPRGGFHIYLKMPEKYRGDRFRKNMNKDYPGIDWLTKGSYCVIAGCEKTNDGVKGYYTWADEDFGEFDQSVEVPEAVIRLTRHNGKGKTENRDGRSRSRSRSSQSGQKGLEGGSDDVFGSDDNDGDGDGDDLGDFEGLIGGSSSGNWSEEKVLAMLDRLDNNMTNEDWTKVGMALQDWDPVRGLELWEQWSVGGDTYREGECEKRWRSFDIGDGVTMGTISYMVKDANYEEASMKVAMMVGRIEQASEKVLEFEIIPEIKKTSPDRGNKLHKEKLVKAIQDRYKVVSGVRMPVASIRQSITAVGGAGGGRDGDGDGVVSGYFIEEVDAPKWCEDWIYANSHTGYVDMHTLQIHKAESFNNRNGKYIPENETGSKPSASKYVADKGFLNNVDSIYYMPSREERLCVIGGLKILNSFNKNTIPVEAKEFTDEGNEAIAFIERHIRIMCGSDKNARILTQWFAHNIQFPGRQILWAPIIQSIPGLGKTFFAELLRTCLGDANVGTVSPSQITSDFNAWATDVCVNSLEEFRVKGQNRYEAVNALKPLITDRVIQINPKGVKPYTTQNTTNYFACTNDKDSIPMDITDRRWWIIFVAISSLDDFSCAVGENTVSYFPRLFGVLRSHGSEVRKWLLEYEIDAEFLTTKQAPMTDDKLSMIAAEESGFEGLSEVRDLIESGHKRYNEDCVSSSDLFDQLAFHYPEVEVTNRSKNAILKKLGYMPVGSPIKIDGKARRIWTKKKMTNEEIRLEFQK